MIKKLKNIFGTLKNSFRNQTFVKIHQKLNDNGQKIREKLWFKFKFLMFNLNFFKISTENSFLAYS